MHTVNPVLTTILTAVTDANPWDMKGQYSATLYDVSHTLTRLIGVTEQEIDEIFGVFQGGEGTSVVE